MEELNQMLAQVQEIMDKNEAEERRQSLNGENFNIFNILGQDRKEQAHSLFLAELLNPLGTHGQKDAFLKAFLQQVVPDFPLDTHSAQVRTEFFIGETNLRMTHGGRIDIFIWDKYHHALIIENKIDAYDQPHQLERYDNYAKSQNFDDYRLLYLTLEGEEASDDSTHNGKVDYLRVSYREDIIAWLQTCEKISENKVALQNALHQYLQTIQDLLDMMNFDYGEQMLNVLTTPENIRTTLEICKRRDNIATKICANFIEKIKALVESKNLNFKEVNDLSNLENQAYLEIYDPKISTTWGLRIGAENHTKSNGGVFYGIGCIQDAKSKLLKCQVTELPHIFNEQDQNKNYPFGWAYLRDEFNNFYGCWWDWDANDTLTDMLNGKMLKFIEEEIIDVMLNERLLNKVEKLCRE